MRPNAVLVALLCAAPSLTAAFPSAHCEQPRPWRRLADQIIRTLWNIPDTSCHAAQTSALAKLGDVTPASRKLLARYGEDVVIRFNITNDEEARALADAADVLFLDVWEFTDNWADVRLAKDVVPSLLGLLPATLHTAHQPLLRDVDLMRAILDSYPSSSRPVLDGLTTSEHTRSFTPTLHQQQPPAESNLFFRDYQPYSVILPWMRLLTSMFPTHVRLFNIGISYEGRDIPALRVGVHPTNNQQPSGPRKTIIVAGGSHAREWISTSSVNYVAYHLITSYGKSPVTTRLLEAFDWVFVPTLNPDGFVYTWETDRLWRKNRQPTNLRFCQGVDLDRSWPFMWDGELSPGSSNPCSESFAGSSPFDGAEAERFAQWARNETENNNVDIVAFLDLHSYSQQVLYPYSYSCNAAPPSLEDLEELALGLAKAMRLSKSGHWYGTRSACEGNVNINGKKQKILPRMETGGGSALDWFYHELQVKYAYQIKLRDTGSYGFLLPKEHIVPTGKEVLDAVQYLGKHLLGMIGMDGEEDSFGRESAPRPGSLHKFQEGEEQRGGGKYGVMGKESGEVVGMEEDEGDYQWELKKRRRR